MLRYSSLRLLPCCHALRCWQANRVPRAWLTADLFAAAVQWPRLCCSSFRSLSCLIRSLSFAAASASFSASVRSCSFTALSARDFELSSLFASRPLALASSHRPMPALSARRRSDSCPSTSPTPPLIIHLGQICTQTVYLPRAHYYVPDPFCSIRLHLARELTLLG